jgi:hypothetical protein
MRYAVADIDSETCEPLGKLEFPCCSPWRSWPLTLVLTPREHVPALPAAGRAPTQARARCRQPSTAILRLLPAARSRRLSSASHARTRSCPAATATTVPNTKSHARAGTGAPCRSVVARSLQAPALQCLHPGDLSANQPRKLLRSKRPEPTSPTVGRECRWTEAQCAGCARSACRRLADRGGTLRATVSCSPAPRRHSR